MAEPFSLVEEPEESKLDLGSFDLQPSISPTFNTLTLPTEVAEDEAVQMDSALGERSPGVDTLQGSLERGERKNITDLFMDDQRDKATESKARLIENFFKNRPNPERPLTPDDDDQLEKLFNIDTEPDKNIVIQDTLSAKYIMDGLARAAATNPALQEVLDDPRLQDKNKTAISGAIKMGFTINLIRDAIEEFNQIEFSLPRTFQDAGELLFLPGQEYFDLKLLGEDIGVDLPEKLLPGPDIDGKIDFFYRQTKTRQTELLPQIVEALAARNRFNATFFLQKMLIFGLDTERFENLIGAIDVGAGVTTFGQATILIKAGLLFKALQFLITGSIRRRVGLNSASLARGDVASAVANKARKKFADLARNSPETKSFREVTSELPSLYNLRQILSGSDESLTALSLDRITTMMKLNVGKFLEAATDVLNIKRIDDADVTTLIPILKRQVVDTFSGVEDKILDVKIISSDKTLTRTTTARHTIGDMNNELFLDEAAATYHIELYGLPAGTPVRPKGGGRFAIELDVTLNENDPFIKALKLTARQLTPGGTDVLRERLRRFETGLDSLSVELNEAKLIAATGTSRVSGVFLIIDDALSTMSRASRKRLNQFLNKEQRRINPNGEQGRFAKNIGELQDQWRKQFDRSPTDREVAGYLAYRQLNDLDLMMRNIATVGSKAKSGLKEIEVALPKGSSVTVEAVPTTIKALRNDVSAGVLHLKGNGTIGLDDLERAKVAAIRPGNQIFQISDKGMAALEETPGIKKIIGGSTIHFVIAKTPKINALRFKQLVTTEGGHLIQKGRFFTVQPKAYREIDPKTGTLISTQYTGDVALLGHTSKAEALKYKVAFDKARSMLNAATRVGADGVASLDPALARNLGRFLSGNLPYTLRNFVKLFRKLNPEEGILSLDAPILTTRFGKSAGETHKLEALPFFRQFRDNTKGAYHVTEDLDKTFITDRSKPLMTVRERGGQDNPLLTLTRAPIVDALPALERGLSSLVNSSFINDYKIVAANAFVKQFDEILEGTNLTRNPVAHLYNPQFRAGADEATRRVANNYIESFKQFMNVKSPTDEVLLRFQNNLADTIYKRVGQKGVEIADPILARIKDPTTFMRAAAFHMTLGMFNPVQLFVQSTTFTTMAALSGTRNTLKSMPAAYMMQLASHTLEPKILRRLAHVSGWKPQHFNEVFALLNRSGFGRLGKEQALLDNVFSPKVFTTKAGRFLDGAAVFFNGIERNLRHTSMASAYRQWRVANPKAKFTDAIQRQVLTEASRLNVDMISSANAFWQKGWPSVMTQFWAYPTRMMEQLLSKKRLSHNDRMRSAVFYGMLFGAPTMGSIFTTIPFSDMLRDRLTQKGIVPSNIGMQTFEQGMLATMTGWITGTTFDVAQRLSPEGLGPLQTLLDAWNGDKGVFEIALGFAGGKLGQTLIDTSTPVIRFFLHAFNEDGRDLPLITDAEYRAITGNISAYREFQKFTDAILHQTYFTKAGRAVGKFTVGEAQFSSLFGVIPRRFTTMFSAANAVRKTVKDRKVHRDNIVKELRFYFKAFALGDEAGMDRAMLSAKFSAKLGQFTNSQYADIKASVMEENRGFLHLLNTPFLDKTMDTYDARLKLMLNLKATEDKETERNK